MAIPNQIEIANTTNNVTVQTNNNQITVVNESKNIDINIIQPAYDVIQVAIPGPAGPPGITPILETSSLATTGSNNFVGNQIITGSLTVSNSTNLTGGLTASSAIISGNVIVQGTASINTLIVNQTQLSTGSNQLGDDANDTQTLFGTVRIPTGSLTVTGSLIASSSNATQLQVGSNLLFVSSSGRVGVGTTNPISSLHIVGSGISNSTFGLVTYNSSNVETFQVRDDGAVKFGTGSFFHPSNTRFQINNMSGTELLRMSDTSLLTVAEIGNLGAGGLTITGNASLSLKPGNGNSGIIDIGTSQVNTVLNNNITRNFAVFTQGWNALSGSSNLTMNALTVANSINFVSSSGTNIGRGLYVNPTLTGVSDFRAIETTAGSILFQSGSTPLFFVSGSGRVGIGTSTPAYSLDIRNGDLFVTSSRIAYISNIRPADNTGAIIFSNFGGTESGRMLMDSGTWRFKSQNQTDVINIFTNGNLGIRQTSNAGFALDVAGTSRFTNNMIVTGSLTVTNNLTVLGSASIQYISESVLNIGTNLITVNTLSPTVRFGGLAVIDSGSSPLGSGSFLYDSVQDEFIFVHRGDGTNITSSHFLVGPETYNNLGNEIYVPNNTLLKSQGNEHVTGSNITDTGTLVNINSNTSVTGSLTVTGSIRSSFSTGFNNTTTDGGLVLTNPVVGSVAMGVTSDGALRIKNNLIGTAFINASDQIWIQGNDIFTFNSTGIILRSNITNTTSTNNGSLIVRNTVNYTNASHVYNALSITSTITGSAGVVGRGLYVNPTLTSSIDFRAIETTAGSILFQSGSTPLLFVGSNGNVGIGTSTPTSRLDINNTLSSTVGLTIASPQTSAGSLVLSTIGTPGINNGALLILRHADGTFPTPGVTAASRVISSQLSQYFNGSSYVTATNIIDLSDGKKIFGATPSYGGTLTYYGKLDSGNWYFGDLSTTIGTARDRAVSSRVQIQGSGATSSTTAFRVENSNATASLVVRDDLRVGINNASPAYTLDVDGNAQLGNNNYYARLTSGGSDGGIFRVGGPSYGEAELKSNGLSLNGGHSISGTGGTSQFSIVSNVAPVAAQFSNAGAAMKFIAENSGSGGGVWPAYSTALAFNFLKKESNGTYTSTFSINGNGNNIGIGTITPAARLHVSGSASSVLLIASSSAGPALFVSGSGRVGIGTNTPTTTLDVFRPLTGTGTIATFYGYQAPFQLEASIEVGAQSSDTGVAVLGGSNFSTLLGGFLQTKNGQRALSFNQLGIVSIGTTQISSSQYSALTIGGGASSIGALVPNKIGLQLASIPRTIPHIGPGTLQSEVAFNSFGISSLSALVSPTTYTNAYNVYIDGAPTAGSAVTFTNRYALYVNSGSSYFGGNVGIGTGTPTFNLDVSGSGRFTNNVTVTGSVIIDGGLFDTLTTGSLLSGSHLLYSFSTASYQAGFFDYYVTSGSNFRAGTIMSVAGAGTYRFTDQATPDIGDTTNLQFSMSLDTSNLQLYASASSNGWTVKTTFRTI